MAQVQLFYQDSESPQPQRFGCEKPFRPFVDLTAQLAPLSSDERRIALINKLLAEERANAVDHERTGTRFYGSAVVKTQQGQWFLACNMQLQHPDTTRNCAEARAAGEARSTEGKDMKIAELWFMGGRGNFDEDMPFMNNVGQRNTPCGSCLDIIHDHRLHVGAETIVQMVPLNDGTMKLLPGDPHDPRAEQEIEPNRVFSRTIRQLLPHTSYQLADVSGKQKSMIKKSYEWLHNRSAVKAIGNAQEHEELQNLQALEKNGASVEVRMLAINALLMHAARETYQTSRISPELLTVAIVRDADGKYYIGRHTSDGTSPGSDSAETHALWEMQDKSASKHYTDIFIAHFSPKDLSAVAGPDMNRADSIPVYVPDGANREVLKKFAPQNGDLATTRDFSGTPLDQSRGNVHIFLPNVPELHEFNPLTHVVSLTIRDLLPYGYRNPKSDNGGIKIN